MFGVHVIAGAKVLTNGNECPFCNKGRRLCLRGRSQEDMVEKLWHWIVVSCLASHLGDCTAWDVWVVLLTVKAFTFAASAATLAGILTDLQLNQKETF